MGLSSSSASLHDLAVIILGGHGVPAPFPGPRLRPEKIGGVCGEGGGCMSSRSFGDLGPPKPSSTCDQPPALPPSTACDPHGIRAGVLLRVCVHQC